MRWRCWAKATRRIVLFVVIWCGSIVHPCQCRSGWHHSQRHAFHDGSLVLQHRGGSSPPEPPIPPPRVTWNRHEKTKPTLPPTRTKGNMMDDTATSTTRPIHDIPLPPPLAPTRAKSGTARVIPQPPPLVPTTRAATSRSIPPPPVIQQVSTVRHGVVPNASRLKPPLLPKRSIPPNYLPTPPRVPPPFDAVPPPTTQENHPPPRAFQSRATSTRDREHNDDNRKQSPQMDSSCKPETTTRPKEEPILYHAHKELRNENDVLAMYESLLLDKTQEPRHGSLHGNTAESSVKEQAEIPAKEQEPRLQGMDRSHGIPPRDTPTENCILDPMGIHDKLETTTRPMEEPLLYHAHEKLQNENDVLAMYESLLLNKSQLKRHGSLDGNDKESESSVLKQAETPAREQESKLQGLDRSHGIGNVSFKDTSTENHLLDLSFVATKQTKPRQDPSTKQQEESSNVDSVATLNTPIPSTTDIHIHPSMDKDSVLSTYKTLFSYSHDVNVMVEKQHHRAPDVFSDNEQEGYEYQEDDLDARADRLSETIPTTSMPILDTSDIDLHPTMDSMLSTYKTLISYSHDVNVMVQKQEHRVPDVFSDNEQDDYDAIKDASVSLQQESARQETMLVRRKTQQTKKVPRQTILSSLTDHQVDLTNEEFDELLRDMLLPSMTDEEYSVYEYDEEIVVHDVDHVKDKDQNSGNDDDIEVSESAAVTVDDSSDYDSQHVMDNNVNPFLEEEESMEYDNEEYEDEVEYESQPSQDEYDEMQALHDESPLQSEAHEAAVISEDSQDEYESDDYEETQDDIGEEDVTFGDGGQQVLSPNPEIESDNMEQGTDNPVVGSSTVQHHNVPHDDNEVHDAGQEFSRRETLAFSDLDPVSFVAPVAHNVDIGVVTDASQEEVDNEVEYSGAVLGSLSNQHVPHRETNDMPHTVIPPPPVNERTQSSTPIQSGQKTVAEEVTGLSRDLKNRVIECHVGENSKSGHKHVLPPPTRPLGGHLPPPPHKVPDGHQYPHPPKPIHATTASSSTPPLEEIRPPPPKPRQGLEHESVFDTTRDPNSRRTLPQTNMPYPPENVHVPAQGEPLPKAIVPPDTSIPPPPPVIPSATHIKEYPSHVHQVPPVQETDTFVASESDDDEEDLDENELRLLGEANVMFDMEQNFELDVYNDDDEDSMDEDDWRILQLSQWSNNKQPGGRRVLDIALSDSDDDYDMDYIWMEELAKDDFAMDHDVLSDDLTDVGQEDFDMPQGIFVDQEVSESSSTEEEEETMFLGDSAVDHLPNSFGQQQHMVGSPPPPPRGDTTTVPYPPPTQQDTTRDTIITFGLPHPPQKMQRDVEYGSGPWTTRQPDAPQIRQQYHTPPQSVYQFGQQKNGPTAVPPDELSQFVTTRHDSVPREPTRPPPPPTG